MCGIYECKITSFGTLEVTDNIVSTNEISVENSQCYGLVFLHVYMCFWLEITDFFYLTLRCDL